MLNPLTLPSGKILDLKRFIALLPTEKGYDLILEGFSSPISLETTDGETITNFLKIYLESQPSEQNFIEIPSNLDSYREKQLQKNQLPMKLLKQWIERDKNRQPTPEEKEYEEEFKRIIDAERIPEQKLYSK